ncbi:MAG: PucR family transcriptional regulator [Marmoricola sp.]
MVDRTSSHVALAYHRTERDLLRADEQRSAALWEELLRGRAQEPVFASTFAQTVDLPVEGPFLAVTLSGSMHDLAAPLRRASVPSAFHRRTDSVVGVLATGAVPVPTVLRVLAAAGARGGVSAPVATLAGIDEAFRQAAVALRSVPPGIAEVAAYDDRLVAGLLLGSPEVADRLVQRWLGPVFALPPAEARVLLQTLGAWVRAGGAMTRTASLAHCHRNTATNRVNRVATLVGFTLVEGVVPLEIELALRWLDLTG